MTWNRDTVGTDEDKTPPQQRVFRYDLDVYEKMLLKAMWEHAPEGRCSASLSRLSAYSSISVGKIKYMIHGTPGSKGHRHKSRRGLLARGILTLLNSANARGKKQPARYQINEQAIPISLKMRRYLEADSQKELFERVPTEGVTAWPGHGVTGSRMRLKGSRRDPNSLSTDSLKTTSSSATATKGSHCDPIIDRSQMSKLLSQFCPNTDQQVLDRIIQDVLRKRSDARTEEILHFLAVKGAQSLSRRIENPAGFLIAAVPECFAGEAFEEWRNLRAAEVERAAVKAAVQADVEAKEKQWLEANVTGKCLSCARPRFVFSSWTKYCGSCSQARHDSVKAGDT